MEIKAAQVKELRDMTGVAMMDCKKALVECDGDIEKALDLLRSNSALKAEKKSSRVAADGILVTSISDGYATPVISLNSLTCAALISIFTHSLFFLQHHPDSHQDPLQPHLAHPIF